MWHYRQWCIMNHDFSISLDYLRYMVLKVIKGTLITALPICGLKYEKWGHVYIVCHAFSRKLELFLPWSRYMVDVVAGVGLLYLFLRKGMAYIEFIDGKLVSEWGLYCNHRSSLAYAQRWHRPNSVTAVCIGLESLDLGWGLHNYILEAGLFFDDFIGNSLIDMYGKCGCLG